MVNISLLVQSRHDALSVYRVDRKTRNVKSHWVDPHQCLGMDYARCIFDLLVALCLWCSQSPSLSMKCHLAGSSDKELGVLECRDRKRWSTVSERDTSIGKELLLTKRIALNKAEMWKAFYFPLPRKSENRPNDLNVIDAIDNL